MTPKDLPLPAIVPDEGNATESYLAGRDDQPHPSTPDELIEQWRTENLETDPDAFDG